MVEGVTVNTNNEQFHDLSPLKSTQPAAIKTQTGPSAPPETEGGSSAPKGFNIEEIPVSERHEIRSQEDLDQVLAAHRRWIEGVFDLEMFVPGGRAQLSGVDLRPFVLRGRDLSGANLAQACLQEMDLRDVNFTTANLVGANLACAQLDGAKFRGAKLKKTDLRGADLSQADLTGADLSHAVLRSEDSETSVSPQAPGAREEASGNELSGVTHQLV